MSKLYKVELTDRQAWIALHALENESYNEGSDHTYEHVAEQFERKLNRAGWKRYEGEDNE